MQWVRRAGAVAHFWLWAVLLAAFLLVNTFSTVRNARSTTIPPFGKFQSSDALLLFATGGTEQSDRLVTLFDSLRPSNAILILVNWKDPRSQFIGEAVAYLSWPHPVRFVDALDPNAAGEVASMDPASVAAIVFCTANPLPWLPPGRRFASDLAVSVVNGAQ